MSTTAIEGGTETTGELMMSPTVTRECMAPI
jgi:hypothetical protein